MEIRSFCQKKSTEKEYKSVLRALKFIFRLAHNSIGLFLIRLSNGMLQRKFQDGSELIIGINSVHQSGEYEVDPLRKFFLESFIIAKKNTLEDLVHRISNRRKEGQKTKKTVIGLITLDQYIS
jgi:hypothetical protein